MIAGKKILVTGATGRVALPMIRVLAQSNDVWGLARFRDPALRDVLEGLGVACVQKDLASDPFDDLPTDFTHVFHAGAVVFCTVDWREGMRRLIAKQYPDRIVRG